MLKVATLASGSSGNCTVVSDGQVHILIDAGISAKRICCGLAELGIRPEELAAVLITHEHSDHIGGLQVLCKKVGADIYATESTADRVCFRAEGLRERFRVFAPGDDFPVGGLRVGSFATSHDCACPVGYHITGGGRKMTLCTDTGVVTREVWEGVQGARLLVAEFNYDEEMLRTGPYPPPLKDRIRGFWGHLSNEAGGELAAHAALCGTEKVVLAHLSKENNLPELALAAARRAMEALGAEAELYAAPRDQSSGWMEV